MIKPNTYDSAFPVLPGTFQPLPAGGYVCVIENAIDTVTKGDKSPMLVLEIDIDLKHGADGEKWRGHFRRIFENRSRENPYAAWPGNGKYYQPYSEKSMNSFKGLIEKAIIPSNPDFEWKWDEKSLIGKYLGMIFREEEYIGNDGNIHMTARPAFPRPVDDIMMGKFTIPPRLKVETQNEPPF